MKKLVVVVVILAAVLLLAPFGVGKLAESRMNHGLDKLVEQAPYFVVAERKWTGGWFKSRQEVTFELAPAFADAMSPAKLDEIFGQATAAQEAPEAEDPGMDDGEGEEAEPEADEEAADEKAPAEESRPASPLRLKVFNDVLHGPVLGLSGLGVARVDTTIDLPPDVVAGIRKVFGPERALEVRTRIGFFGGGTTTFTSEGRTLNVDDEDSVISYETFKLAVGYGRNFDSYDFDGKLPKLDAKSAGTKHLVISNMTLDGDGERVMGELYDGEVAFRIEDISFQDSGAGNNFKIEDVHYIVDTTTKDDFVAIGAKLGSGEIENPALAATGLDIKEIHYDFSLRKLRAEPLEKILRAIRDAYAVSPMASSPEAVEAAFIEPMKEHAAEILKHDPELSFDRIGLVTAEGEGMLKGLVKFVGVTTDDFAAPSGMGLVSKLDADLTVEVAVKLVEKLPNGATVAGAGVDSGFVKRDGEKYVCHIVFRNGELTVNGKPQMIPGLGGPPGGAMDESGEMPPGE